MPNTGYSFENPRRVKEKLRLSLQASEKSHSVLGSQRRPITSTIKSPVYDQLIGENSSKAISGLRNKNDVSQSYSDSAARIKFPDFLSEVEPAPIQKVEVSRSTLTSPREQRIPFRNESSIVERKSTISKSRIIPANTLEDLDESTELEYSPVVSRRNVSPMTRPSRFTGRTEISPLSNSSRLSSPTGSTRKPARSLSQSSRLSYERSTRFDDKNLRARSFSRSRESSATRSPLLYARGREQEENYGDIGFLDRIDHNKATASSRILKNVDRSVAPLYKSTRSADLDTGITGPRYSGLHSQTAASPKIDYTRGRLRMPERHRVEDERKIEAEASFKTPQRQINAHTSVSRISDVPRLDRVQYRGSRLSETSISPQRFASPLRSASHGRHSSDSNVLARPRDLYSSRRLNETETSGLGRRARFDYH